MMRRIVSLRLRILAACCAAWIVGTAACGPRSSSAQDPTFGARFPCDMPPAALASFIQALPSEALAASLTIDVAQSSLGDMPGPGPILEVSPDRALVNGQPLAGGSIEDRVLAFERWAGAFWAEGAPARPKAPLYVASQGDVDIQTLRAFVNRIPKDVELRLLLRTTPSTATPASNARTLAARLLTERDPAARRTFAQEGYAAFSHCAALDEAVRAVDAFESETRWPQLRTRLAAALPACRCEEVDTKSLRSLILAEQRAGTLSLGFIPLSFLRDERCGASMPLRSITKLVGQIEAFDAEFAGEYQEDAIAFEQVLTNDRLLTYFCNALPGETLAALQRRRATLYQKRAGQPACEGWQFQPLEPGSPMGTWHRRDTGQESLALHYRQSAEELRVYGPVTDAGRPPAHGGPWTCQQTYRLTGIDADGIEHDKGRWFFTEAACVRSDQPNEAPLECATEPPRTIGGESPDAVNVGDSPPHTE